MLYSILLKWVRMSDNFEFDLNTLLVEDQEVPPPVVIPVSVVVSETEYSEQEDVDKLRENIKNEIMRDFTFHKLEARRYKEGFLSFDSDEDHITSVYARETPARIDFELDDLIIHTKRIKHINPSYRVKLVISPFKDKTRVALFGGDIRIVAKALRCVNICIRRCIRGSHKTYETGFSQDDMEIMLENFGQEVQHVYIAPGDNQKLEKIVERMEKGEVKRIPLYSVHTKFAGYRITASPIVLGLIKEQGIRIRELEGRLNFGVGIQITTRISINGRILFYVPQNLIGRNENAYDFAEKLYNRIIGQRSGTKQRTIEEYLDGTS